MKAALETPARAPTWERAVVVRFLKAREAVEAEGRVRRVGTVRVERV